MSGIKNKVISIKSLWIIGVVFHLFYSTKHDHHNTTHGHVSNFKIEIQEKALDFVTSHYEQKRNEIKYIQCSSL